LKKGVKAVAIGFAGVLLGFGTWILLPLPRELTAPPAAPSLTLLDRHGLPLRTARTADGNFVQWITLEQFDPQIIQAFVAVEDRRFYTHSGVDARGIARAMRDNIRAGHVVSGASTITMQLARILAQHTRSVRGKLLQMLWAWRLEAHLTKQQILEQYLNRVPLGEGALGVPAAAALYFEASPTQLSLGQAALLAGLARAPSVDNPFASLERARARRDVALRRMSAQGYANAADIERAGQEPLVARERRNPFFAPHYTARVVRWADTEGRPLDGTVRTSLDLDLQAAIEGEVRHTVEVLRDRGVAHAAAVVLSNATGEILAWVGSPDFWADTSGQVDMVISPRQPGSALKPFLYAMAFERGVTPATILADVPRTYQTSIGPYRPRNYDRRFHGPVRAREALASSFNVPAVELTERFGAAALLETLHRAGFTTLDRPAEHYGLGLALGNGDVTLLELANAYRALANGGEWRPYQWRARSFPLSGFPERGSGGEAGNPERGDNTHRVVSRAAAALVLDILEDPVARLPGFGSDTPFEFAFPAAVKTGTSRHFTDNWAVAVTGGFTVAVWVGNFSGQPMKQVSGITGAGPLLHRAVLAVAQRYEPGALTEPRAVGAVPVRICRLSGLRAVPDCPSMTEWFLPGTEPVLACDWHRNGRVALPAMFAEWAGENGIGASASVAGFRIVAPLDGDVYHIPPNVNPRYATIALRAEASGPVRWLIDGREMRTERWTPVPGRHEIRAVSPVGDTASVRIEVAP